MRKRTPEPQVTSSSSQPFSLAAWIRQHVELFRYVVVTLICAFGIFILSIAMTVLVNFRSGIDEARSFEVRNVYRGEVLQNAPSLNKISLKSDLLQGNSYSDVQLEEFAKNANIVSSNIKVDLAADFVKKGLQYEPTFRTSFAGDYVLKNNLDKESVVSFEFPFPSEVNSSELTNVKLMVGESEVPKAKAKVMVSGIQVDGLRWEGKLAGDSTVIIHVAYDTIGVAGVNYEGFDNTVGSQDFAMEMKITGTRDYNLAQGLSVDNKTFGDKSVTLKWDKKNLFSRPQVRVNIGRKLSPSIQVSKVYAVMAPLYLLYTSMLIWLGYKNRRKLSISDLFTTAILFGFFFPLWHYLTSFTIDPTMEFFSSLSSVSYFSMPLYGGFGIAFALTLTLLTWLYGKIYGGAYTRRAVLPATLICLGFFPLALTVPDYSILLTLLGIFALVAMWISVRLQSHEEK